MTRQEYIQSIRISDQEKAIVTDLAAGKVFKQIAAEQGIKEGTLKTVLVEIRRRYGCENSVNLVATLIRNNVIQ
jgi:DNA-binding NarL/FixJ family response regulator